MSSSGWKYQIFIGLIPEYDENEEPPYKECLPSRIKRDHDEVQQLVYRFQRFHAFQQEQIYDLMTLTTGDITPIDICEDLMHACQNGNTILSKFITKRLKREDGFLSESEKDEFQNICFSLW